MPTELHPRALSVRQAAQFLGVGRGKVLHWIHSGRLGAIDVAADGCPHPQYRVLPRHLEAFEQSRSAGPPPPRPRRKRIEAVDYFPGGMKKNAGRESCSTTGQKGRCPAMIGVFSSAANGNPGTSPARPATATATAAAPPAPAADVPAPPPDPAPPPAAAAEPAAAEAAAPAPAAETPEPAAATPARRIRS